MTMPETGEEHQPEPGPAPASGGRGKGRGFVVEIIQTIVLTVAIFVIIQSLIAQPFQVHGDSMQHSFEQGQYVLVDRISHLWSPYGRGQVIVFNPPEGWGEAGYPFIKRVIGLAGDTVELRDGLVYVNGTQLNEPYLFTNDAGVPGPTNVTGDQPKWVVPSGDLFVMGDHREASEDSRMFGPVAISAVIGRGLVRYWPLSAFEVVPTPVYSPAIPAP